MSSELVAHSSQTANTGAAAPEKRKRTKYAAKACVECKRRKVKCCGEHPCQRCRRRMMDCVFTPDEVTADSRKIEELLEQISKMQTQIDSLTGTVESFNSMGSSSPKKRKLSRSTVSAPSKGSQNAKSERSQSASATGKISFHGVTTSSFNFEVARQTLRSRGITEVGGGTSGSDGDEYNTSQGGEVATRNTSPILSPSTTRDEHHQPSSTIDPLWGINREEAIRLCHVYEEEMGIMYPVVDFETIIYQVHVLYNHLNPLSSSEQNTKAEPLSDDDINILKLVFACALTAEANGNSELAMRIFRGVRDVASDMVWQPPNIKRAILITLVSIYLFQIDEEATAWRTIGTAQRLCLEMGLHRSETYPQPAIVSYGKEDALKLFWSVYTLDIRFSMGTGMPYQLDSSDIDPSLPRPTNVPYLNTMINYNRIAEKVWRFITSPNRNQQPRMEEMAYLDWQVTQWYNSIPEFLKIPDPSIYYASGNEQHNEQNKIQQDAPRSTCRLKYLLYLRADLMKILIYRPILYTPSQIAQSPVEAATVVDIAKNTISFITHLNNHSNIYQLQQITFNWFLISALAVLFLAVAHAPGQFTSSCKDEFYMALGLIEGFSMHSYISQRLWKSIKGLRKLGPKIGLAQKSAEVVQPLQQVDNYSTPTGMDTVHHESISTDILPSHQYRQPLPLAASTTTLPTQQPSPDDFLLTDSTQMSRELMDWFEAMGGLHNSIFNHSNNASGEPESGYMDAGVGGSAGWNGMLTDTTSWPATDDFMFGGYGSDLASILKDCF
ncbi:C6 transcription factor, putative [Talaromyces stipitatus ATCC 10500]|uniref:C6 transcription factor, putative n=1 Tax=Talaromyces stipitatus (strain ATCC 10500 / CBS 375.48 / QM 6759 / NRRL 1006) TaxID=441959 RepID=B8MAA0_TALSN|nr:C6 transcription factor, putative [Talaromyces stipitatus ATCC 10500]EED18602.1 C6 transcription factor, putative [Talaromyces stipitatus ATCC 10500]